MINIIKKVIFLLFVVSVSVAQQDTISIQIKIIESQIQTEEDKQFFLENKRNYLAKPEYKKSVDTLKKLTDKLIKLRQKPHLKK